MADKFPREVKRPYLSKVKAAREVIASQALATYKQYMKVLKQAAKMGKVEVAAEGLQWLLEHTPADDGTTVIDQSIDRPKPVEGYSGPQINIGFALGGVNMKRLTETSQTPEVINVVPELEEMEKP